MKSIKDKNPEDSKNRDQMTVFIKLMSNRDIFKINLINNT